MNYFYDLLVNLNDENAYFFYEWDKNDNIIHLKKIPIIKIDHDDFKNFISSQIIVEQSFLNLIYNKTETYDKEAKFVEYMALLTDGNDSIVIEFNNIGLSISRSYLLLEEELDLLELAYSLPKDEFSYKMTDKIVKRNGIRQEENIRNFLLREIDTLYNDKNKEKLKYLYNEMTNSVLYDLDELRDKFISTIKKDFNKSHLNVYEIIKLSYNGLST